MKKIILFLFLFQYTLLFSQSLSNYLNEQDSLLDNLETQFIDLTLKLESLRLQTETLDNFNQELNIKLENTTSTINELKNNLEDYKKALSSNKDDTSHIIGLFTEAQTELENIKKYVITLEKDRKRLKISRITSLSISGSGIIILTSSFFVTNPQIKQTLLWTGGSLTSAGLIIFTITLF